MINVVYAFFDTFGIIDAATQGGPGQSTSILVYKVYQDGFKALDLGGSAAQSVILMLIVVVLTVIQFRYVEKKVQYQSWSIVIPGLPSSPPAVLLLGVAIKQTFPLACLALVASTHTADAIVQSPCHCCPARIWRENYREALLSSRASLGSNTNVVQMMWVSFVVAMVITQPWARSPSRCCRPLPSSTSASRSRWSASGRFFLTLMLPVSAYSCPPTWVVAELGMLSSYAGLTPSPDCLGSRRQPVPSVLPDRAGRAERWRPPASTAPAPVCAFQDIPWCPCPRPRLPRCS